MQYVEKKLFFFKTFSSSIWNSSFYFPSGFITLKWIITVATYPLKCPSLEIIVIISFHTIIPSSLTIYEIHKT